MKVVCLVFALLVASAVGEVQLICPPASIGNEYTELTPGPRTIVFRQTNAIDGSPFRLSIYRQNQECVVLDHIPYQADSDTYYITVNIPDSNCPRSQNCRLVIRQIDTSSTGYCQFASCMQYNSTALISIRSTGAFTCNRRNPSRLYNWPYEPTQRYMASLTSSSSNAVGMGTFVYIGYSSLLYNITITTPFDSTAQPGRIELFYYTRDNRTMTIGFADFDNTNSWSAGSWFNLDSQVRYRFTTSSLYVRVWTTAGDMSISGPITPSNNRAIADNLYGKEYGWYNNAGWLFGGMFEGPRANATFFAKPTGACINATRYFGCMLTNSQMQQGGGTVALSITGTRLVFSADIYNATSPMTRMKIIGAAAPDVDLYWFWTNGYHIDGVLDITETQMTRLVGGLSSIEISTQMTNAELKCDLEEGLVSMLDSMFEKPPVATPTNGTATAFISYTVDGMVSMQITLNSLTSSLVAAHFHGPAYQGVATSSIPFDISSYIRGMNGSSWNIMAKWRNMSATELRYFIEGLYYLNMHTTDNPSGELRGQVSIPGQWLCPTTGTMTNQCTFVWLKIVDGIRSRIANTTLMPYGIGAAVIDRTKKLQYSLAFWNIPSSMDLTVNLMTPEGTIQTTQEVQPSTMRANVQEMSMIYPTGFNEELSQSVMDYAMQGRLSINVVTSDFPNGYMSGFLPPIQRNKCAQQPLPIRVGGANGWRNGQSYPPIRLLQDDMLLFDIVAGRNVYMMENKNRYDGCVFSTATLLQDTTGLFIYNATQTGTIYFASNPGCQEQTPIKFPAYVVEQVPTPMDPSVCSLSLYSFTGEQRLNSSAGPGSLAAAIIGLIVGGIIVGVVVAVAIVLLVKRQSTGDSVDLQNPKA